MWINILFNFIFIIIFIQVITVDTLETLSNSGEKGVAITSFTKDLYLLSSTYKYNIINKNFHSIKNNINDNSANSNNFFKNYEMVEASINLNTNESVFLIAENRGKNNKINLYSFNITATINEENPKLLYNTQSWIDNSRVSLIDTGNDKYFLSYILNETKFENIWFKYTYYEGFEILRTFTVNANIISGMSCFLLYDQFPICFCVVSPFFII